MTETTPEPVQVEEPGQSLTEMLAVEEPQKAEGQPEANGNAKPTGDAKPKDLNALAEKLGMKVEDLYDLEFSYSDGKRLTLGKLKDSRVEQDQLTVRELELEDRRTKYEAETAQTQREFQTLLKALPDNAIKPEFRELLRRKELADITREAELTRKAIPEWADETLRTKELSGMVDLLEKSYGFPKDYLKTNFNHRTIRLARDYYRLKLRVDSAVQSVKKRTAPSTTGKSSPGSQPAQSRPSKPSSVRSTDPRFKSIFD